MQRYIALLRGINVGGTRRVEMKRLKALCESLGYSQVETYKNSGNLIFRSSKKLAVLEKELVSSMQAEFGFEIQTLLKSAQAMRKIADALPTTWQNDDRQRSDVAYLFPEIDTPKILAELPLKKGFVDLRYTHGAVFWNIERKNYSKSQLNKLISHKLYQLMTVRNINTARALAEYE